MFRSTPIPTTTTTTRRARTASVALFLIAVASLSACGTDVGATELFASSTASSSMATAPPSDMTLESVAPADQADGVSITDAWVKSADEGMSAAFGVLTVDGADATVVSATTTASSMIELHETVPGDTGQMAMQEKNGGFTVRDGEDFVLEPGGNHLMLMGISEPLEAGETVTVDLTLSDGSVFTFEAPIKDFSGANETYVGNAAPSEAPSTDMGSHGSGNGDGEASDHGATMGHDDNQ